VPRKLITPKRYYNSAETAMILGIPLATLYRYTPRRTLLTWCEDKTRLRPEPREDYLQSMTFSIVEIQRFGYEVLGWGEQVERVERVDALLKTLRIATNGSII
jgi:hypothetical protein